MADKVEQLEFRSENQPAQAGPVICFGMTFENIEARRAYFKEELRKKLPELRKIEGFPIGEDEDILVLSDPPYYTACPNPWISNFIEEWESNKGSISSEYHRSPYAVDVSEGKTDPLYKAHGYHTKVPHKAIMKYILHYTEPGDIILDGFAGTGMTGVAAQLCGNEKTIRELGYKVVGNEILDEDGNHISNIGERKALLSDLSPAATFISSNYNLPLDKLALEREINEKMKALKNECEWLYTVPVNEDDSEIIFYSVWSDVYHCPSCTSELIFWDIAVEEKTQTLKKSFDCPTCNIVLSKRKLEKVWEHKYDVQLNKSLKLAKQSLVSVNYKHKSTRAERKTSSDDLSLLKKIDGEELVSFFPIDPLPTGYNTAQPQKSHGYTNVHHFYTKRSLFVLSKFYECISESDLRNALLMMLTGVTFATSKLYRWTPNYEGGGPLSGTLYIPALYREISALDALKRFGDKIPKYLTFPKKYGNSVMSVESATNKKNIENAVDYIFVDPPFGGNIMYSELNFMWEAWLKVKTNNKDEAIINDIQEKGLSTYRQLMFESFKSFYLALKPGRWMTVEFSNSQSSIWNSIREAIERAGFVIANVSALDKKQGSFKAITTTTAVKQDLVISAYKPKTNLLENIRSVQNSEDSAWNFVKHHLEQLPIFIGEKGASELVVERTPRILFDRMVAYHVQNGFNVPISSADFQTGIEQRFPMRDGMAFLETQVAQYDKKRMFAKEFMQLSLFVSDENSAIEWLRQQLMKKSQTRQDLHPNFMKEIQHIAKHEILPELDAILEQNFLKYNGDGEVPSQIHTYLSTDYKDFRNLSKNDPKLVEKAKDRWYVPDPNKQADLEKLREKSLLREFNHYVEELSNSKKKLKQFRTEAIRVGFYKAWSEKNYQIITEIGNRLPETILQEDEKLLRYYDNAQTKLGL